MNWNSIEFLGWGFYKVTLHMECLPNAMIIFLHWQHLAHYSIIIQRCHLEKYSQNLLKLLNRLFLRPILLRSRFTLYFLLKYPSHSILKECMDSEETSCQRCLLYDEINIKKNYKTILCLWQMCECVKLGSLLI